VIPDNAMILGLVNNAAILLAAGLLYDLFFFRAARPGPVRAHFRSAK
jgi:hypothetical protein